MARSEVGTKTSLLVFSAHPSRGAASVAKPAPVALSRSLLRTTISSLPLSPSPSDFSAAYGTGRPLFDEVQRYLAAKGLKVATGTIVDVTIISGTAVIAIAV